MSIHTGGEKKILLVAEESVLLTATYAVEGLIENTDGASIDIVVPDRSVTAFKSKVSSAAQVIPESEIIADWDIGSISKRLPQKDRAGWYFQQFLKFEYGKFSGCQSYLIWDADTVLLEPLKLGRNAVNLFCQSKEWHQPYFDSYYKLTGQPPKLRKSAISQYMMIETAVLEDLFQKIKSHTGHESWIEAVISSLPGANPSEFSEYETYANFYYSRHPTSFRFEKKKWFRYGSEILDISKVSSFQEIKRSFDGYSHVAFERHKPSSKRKAYAKIAKILGI